MNTRIGKLGENEWAFMKICWEKGKVSAKNVYDEMQNIKPVKYQTVKTTMDRLVDKHVLAREKFGPIWLYTATVTEKDITTNALNEFVSTVLGNTITPLFIHMFKKKKYNRKEIQMLRKAIEEIEEE